LGRLFRRANVGANLFFAKAIFDVRFRVQVPH